MERKRQERDRINAKLATSNGKLETQIRLPSPSSLPDPPPDSPRHPLGLGRPRRRIMIKIPNPFPIIYSGLSSESLSASSSGDPPSGRRAVESDVSDRAGGVGLGCFL